MNRDEFKSLVKECIIQESNRLRFYEPEQQPDYEKLLTHFIEFFERQREELPYKDPEDLKTLGQLLQDMFDVLERYS